MQAIASERQSERVKRKPTSALQQGAHPTEDISMIAYVIVAAIVVTAAWDIYQWLKHGGR